MKKLFIIFLFLLSSNYSDAAIAFSAASAQSGYSGPALSATINHTIASGDNRILFVGFFAGVNDTVTSVTYNGNAMTLVGKVKTTGNRWNYLYYQVAPDTGTHAIVVNSSVNEYFSITAASYTGAAQTGIPDAYTTDNLDSMVATSDTTTLSSVADNSWFVMTVRPNCTLAVSAGTGSTERADTGRCQGFFDSNGPKTPAGSYSMTYNWGSTETYTSSVMASFAPYVAGSASPVYSDAIIFE